MTAATVPVGLAPGFCGKSAAPVTKTFGVSQTCPYVLVTECSGLVPITQPPVGWVDWYFFDVVGRDLRLEVDDLRRIHLFMIASAFLATNRQSARWLSCQSKLMRRSGLPHLSV